MSRSGTANPRKHRSMFPKVAAPPVDSSTGWDDHVPNLAIDGVSRRLKRCHSELEVPASVSCSSGGRKEKGIRLYSAFDGHDVCASENQRGQSSSFCEEEEGVGERTAVSLALAIFLIAGLGLGYAQDNKDLDNYRWRVQGDWWFSHPSGFFGANGSNNYFDIDRDFRFANYSTFSGKIDWRFRRKHHFLFTIAPVTSSSTATLNRTIEFQGETFEIGSQVTANLRSLSFSPGYQYDIVRRDHGFLGLEVDFAMLYTEGTLKAAASVNGQGAVKSASNSLFAPLPVVGPAGRWYPLHDSNRLSLEGSVRGMYFFGYGDFLTARGTLGVGLTRRLAFRAGYQMGSRLTIQGTSDQIAIRVTQKGPTAGIEYSWGEVPMPAPKPPPSAPTQASDWHVDWVPFYLWFTGLQGNLGAKGFVVPVNVPFSDVFAHLNIGLMTTLDVRRKRTGVLTDLVFISVSSDQKNTPAGNVYSGFTANAKTFFLDSEAYGRVADKDWVSVDALGGVRIWHLNNSLDLLQGSSTAVSTGQTQGWVDPVMGARFCLNLKKGWFLNLKGDAGGFGVGSRVTWQIYSGIGKEIKRKYSLLLGYRYLDVDYSNDGFLYDTHMSGLLAGFGIRFK